MLAPLIYFLTIFGDSFQLAFVERRSDGFHAQFRACAIFPISAVEVTPYRGDIEDSIPFWTATRQGTSGATSVRLFDDAQPGFDTRATGIQKPTIYEVTINKGSQSESSMVVDELALDVGEVEYNGANPVSLAEYGSFRDSDFDCPRR